MYCTAPNTPVPKMVNGVLCGYNLTMIGRRSNFIACFRCVASARNLALSMNGCYQPSNHGFDDLKESTYKAPKIS